MCDTMVAHHWAGSCFELLLAAHAPNNDKSVPFHPDPEERSRDLVACQMLCLDSSSQPSEKRMVPFSAQASADQHRKWENYSDIL